MKKFLSDQLVAYAFKRLSSRRREGKTHLERTSALLYFLAFDAACNKVGDDCLDMNPDSLTGNNNRRQIELEFTKLVTIDNNLDGLHQVYEFGKIEFGGTDPYKRISSNFFTVPLKKASVQKEAYAYPSRPKAPLLKMGLASTGIIWGIAYHDNWINNFPKLLTEIRESTPHLDLAIFLLRDHSFSDNVPALQSAISLGLENRFSKDVANYFMMKIAKEHMFARLPENPFKDRYSSFARIFVNDTTDASDYDKMTKSELIQRIFELEQILQTKG